MNRSFLIAALLIWFCHSAEAQETTRTIRGVSPPDVSNGNFNGDWELPGMSVEVRGSSSVVRDFVVTSPLPSGKLNELEPFNYRDFREKQKAYGIKYPWQMLTPYADRFLVAKPRIDQPLPEANEKQRVESELRRGIEEGDRRLRKAQENGEPKEKIEALARELQAEINAKQQTLEELRRNRSLVPEPPYAIYHHPSLLDGYPYTLPYWTYPGVQQSHSFAQDSQRDPEREFAQRKQSERFQFQPNISRKEFARSGDSPAPQPNYKAPRFVNGVDTLYEKLPRGGFRDLRDDSVWDAIPGQTTMGNIAPYRKQLLSKILTAWHPSKPQGPIVALTISNTGQLINTELIQSSGNKGIDRRAFYAIWFTKFERLPDWFKGEQITFKINMSALAETAVDR